jgi:hypothetical protein
MLLLFLVRAGQAQAADPSPAVPSLPAILEGVIARDAETQRELRSMEYDQTVHTERLDAKGSVTHNQDLKIIVRPDAAQELQVVEVRGDDIPTDPDEAARQAQGKERERRKQTFDLRSLSTRFFLTLQGISNEFGTRAYVVGFEPKPNQPYRTQTEKVLNQLHGRLWIRASDDTILRTEATLLHPVRVAWIFASIDQLEFHYELPPGGSEFGPAWLQTSVEVTAPLIQIRQRQRIDMTHFRPRESIPSATKKKM